MDPSQQPAQQSAQQSGMPVNVGNDESNVAHSSSDAEEMPQALSAEEIIRQAKEIFHRLGPVGIMAAISASLPIVGTALILWALSKTHMAEWLRGQEAAGVAIYIGAYIALAGLALCNTYAPSLAGGFAFGIYTGSFAAMSAVCLAATLGYIVSRRMSGDRVTSLIAEQPKWKAVYNALIGGSTAKTLFIIGLIRLSSSPFAITNLVLGSTRVHPVVYILGTAIGFAPRTIATVMIGAKLSNWDPEASSKWFTVVFIAVTFVVLMIIGTIANHAVQKVTQQEAE